MMWLTIAYLLQSLIYFIGIRLSHIKNNVSNGKLYYMLLLAFTVAGYMLLQHIKVYVIIGFAFAVMLAFMYSLVVIDEESAKELNFELSNVLFLCLIFIISWPQIVAINIADYFLKKDNLVH